MDNQAFDKEVMDILSGKETGGGNWWNYYKPEREGFVTEITGDVVEISCAQSTKYNATTGSFVPQFFNNGDAKRSWILHIKDANGIEILWKVDERSRVWNEDLLPKCPDGSLYKLPGNNVTIQAEQQPTLPDGRKVPFSRDMPRHFYLRINGPAMSGENRGVNVDSYAKVRAIKKEPTQPQPQQQAQQMYTQQQAPVMQAMNQAAAASLLQQNFPGAQVTTLPQAAVQQMVPGNPATEVYAEDLPF